MDLTLCSVWFVYIMLASGAWLAGMFQDMYANARIPVILAIAPDAIAWATAGDAGHCAAGHGGLRDLPRLVLAPRILHQPRQARSDHCDVRRDVPHVRAERMDAEPRAGVDVQGRLRRARASST